MCWYYEKNVSNGEPLYQNTWKSDKSKRRVADTTCDGRAMSQTAMLKKWLDLIH